MSDDSVMSTDTSFSEDSGLADEREEESRSDSSSSSHPSPRVAATGDHFDPDSFFYQQMSATPTSKFLAHTHPYVVCSVRSPLRVIPSRFSLFLKKSNCVYILIASL